MGYESYDLLTQLIFMLDNAEERRGVYIICATTRPYTLHNAMFVSRADKVTFNKFLYVPLPSPEERGMILKALAGNKPIDANVDLMALGKDAACENFSGADLYSLMREAARYAIDRRTSFDGGRRIPIPWTIKDADFKRALKKVAFDVSFPPRNLADYERFSEEEFVRRSR